MREKPDVGAESGVDEEVSRKRLDLSVPQVAGSAVAAVVAAKLASYFGVYGTMLGAGLVSVVATCGGTVFQHFFRRTGEQIRDVTVQARPRTQQTAAAGEFTEGTVYRARVRSWKRPVAAAVLVFGVTMASITTYELVAGHSFSDSRGTTVGDALKGSGSPSPSEPGTPPASSATPSAGSSSAQPPGDADSGTGATTPTPTPSSSATPETGADASTPTPSGAATTPAPSASSRSQSVDPGQADPSAQ
ncbi:hypothetical protein ACFWP7_05565 [Streptomyces sp. NPDC058470]|uniref:hypothetical protein n=1 Tax=Streptomyces sp. NPDC058470 TaxID=3346515 RepID=UPI003668E092